MEEALFLHGTTSKILQVLLRMTFKDLPFGTMANVRRAIVSLEYHRLYRSHRLMIGLVFKPENDLKRIFALDRFRLASAS